MNQTNSFSFIISDMEPFRDVILSIRHNYASDSLEKDIKNLAGPDSNVFLIKMEVMRLSSPSSNRIDLRKYFKDVCKPVEIGGFIHMVDEKAESILRSEFIQYGNRYTIAAEGLVIEDAIKRFQQTPDKKLNKPLPFPNILSLTRFFTRKEERLYFTKKVRLYFEEPNNLSLNKRKTIGIEGVTTNISLSGISIRFKKEELPEEIDQVYIYFYDLESDFVFHHKPIVKYTVIKKATKNDFIYLMLSSSNEDDMVTSEFTKFVEYYINTNRRKHKISTENVAKAVHIKSNEQFVINKLNSLPIYLYQDKSFWVPMAQFNTIYNTNIGIFNNLSNNKSFINAVTRTPFIQNKLDSGRSFSEFIFIFPVNISQNEKRYICVPFDVLSSSEFLIHSAKESLENSRLKLYKIEGEPINTDEQSFISIALPDSIKISLGIEEEKAHLKLKECLDKLSRILVFKEITNIANVLNLLPETLERSQPFPLNDCIDLYTLKNSKKQQEIIDVESDSYDFRCEDRFDHVLDIEIKLYNSAPGTEIKGYTENISSKGLKIKLYGNHRFKMRDIVLITIPKITSNGSVLFKNQPYTILRISEGNIYHLTIQGRAKSHRGRRVLSKYIHDNLQSKPIFLDKNAIPGLSRALRNIYTHNTQSYYGVLVKQGSKRFIRDMLFSENIFNARAINEQLSIGQSVQSNQLVQETIKALNMTNTNIPFSEFYVAVLRRVNSKDESKTIVKVFDNSNKILNELIIKSLKSFGTVSIIGVKVSAKGRIFDKYYAYEYSYLKHYATAKAMKINEMLKETIGIVEFTDLTELVIRNN